MDRSLDASLRQKVTDHLPLITLLLMLLALVLRLLYISGNPMYLDETASVFIAQMTFGDVVEAVARDNNPPLYYVLLHGWMRLAGDGPEAVRLLSVLLSVACVPVVVAIGRRFFNVRVALYAAVLFVFSEMLIYYSNEARTYTLVTFLVLLSFHRLLIFLESGQWKDVILLGTFNFLLLMSHYMAGMVMVLQAFAVVAVAWRNWRMIGRFVVVHLGVGLVFFPWFLYWQASMMKNVSWVAPTSWKLVHFVLLVFSGSKGWLAVFGLLMGLGGPLALIWNWRKRKTKEERKAGPSELEKVGVLALWGLGGMALLGLFSVWVVPAFRENYALFTLPGLLLLLAWIWSEMPLPHALRWTGFVLAVLLMLGGHNFNMRHQKRWDKVSELLHHLDDAQQSTLTLLHRDFYFKPLLYHHDRALFRDYRHVRNRLRKSDLRWPEGGLKWPEKLGVEDYQRVLLVSWDVHLKKDRFRVKGQLEERMKAGRKWRYGDIWVLEYVGEYGE
ncbi:MAG: glycosyltransferase family 39 protein [Bacteroidota bacterium]